MNSNRNDRYASRWSPRSVEAAELGRPHLRIRNPLVSGLLEGITQALYDLYRVAANTAAIKLLLFAQPQGQSYNFGGVTPFAKTILHTNMVQAGMLQSPNKHIVRAISVMVAGIPGAAPNPNITAVDLLNFLHSTLFQFDVNQKPYCQSQVGRFPAGGGAFLSGGSATTVAATTLSGVAVNGAPSTQNTYALMHGGVNIEQTQNFDVLIDPTVEAGGAFTTQATSTVPPGSGISAIVYLDGTLFRAVQ